MTDIPHNSMIEFQHLRLIGTGDEWREEEWGPDLLFIELPQSTQLQSICAKKSFYLVNDNYSSP